MDTRLVPTRLIATFSTILLCSIASGHTLNDLTQDGGEVSDSLARLTRAYEETTDGPLRAQLHAAQHELLLIRQRGAMDRKCIELLTKIPALERKFQKLEKAGKAEEAEQVQVMIDQAKAITTVACPTPPR
ncbi:MAG: hypothetical protein E8D49_09825 [Nitrospira sp.]|nr:MAG: hypothetical protein E8D49_09825 [Nitrospira sp.]